MLHELLACLLGHFGDLVSVPEEPLKQKLPVRLNGVCWEEFLSRHRYALSCLIRNSSIRYTVNANFSLLHPAELAAATELCSLGAMYALLNDFSFALQASESSTLYSKILGTCIASTLSGYEELVVEMEAKVGDDGDPDTLLENTPLTFLLQKTRAWQVNLTLLCNLVVECVQAPEPYLDCALLNVLYSASHSGFSEFQQLAQAMFERTLSLFYKQLVLLCSTGELTLKPELFCVRRSSPGRWQIVRTSIPVFIGAEFFERLQVLAQTMHELRNRPTYYEPLSKFVETRLSEACNQLLRHEEPELHGLTLAAVLSQVETSISDKLWQTLVSDEQLSFSFEFLKATATCGRSDMFDNFILSMEKLGSGSIFIDADALFSDFIATYMKGRVKDDVRRMFRMSVCENSDSTLLPLTLEISPVWPMNLFMSPAVLSAYSSIFNVMFALRQAHLSLTKLAEFRLYGNDAVWTARSSMYGFLNRVWNFLHTAVFGQLYTTLATLWKSESPGILILAVREHENAITRVGRFWFEDSDDGQNVARQLIALQRASMCFCREAGSVMLESGATQGKLKRFKSEFDVAKSKLLDLVNRKAVSGGEVAVDMNVFSLYFENYMYDDKRELIA